MRVVRSLPNYDRLIARGVEIVPLLLHAGVSSPEVEEPPFEEFYRVLSQTADRINAARRAGGKVIAVGTTVVRALETVADDIGTIHPGEGWSRVVISPERRNPRGGRAAYRVA